MISVQDLDQFGGIKSGGFFAAVEIGIQTLINLFQGAVMFDRAGDIDRVIEQPSFILLFDLLNLANRFEPSIRIVMIRVSLSKRKIYHSQ